MEGALAMETEGQLRVNYKPTKLYKSSPSACSVPDMCTAEPVKQPLVFVMFIFMVGSS